jgi:hypothetical protein
MIGGSSRSRLAATRLMLATALIAGMTAVGAAQQPNAPGLGDSFNTNTAPPLSGGVEENDPVRCFDHALRNEQNALQAYQIVYGANWPGDFACRGQVAAAELDPCWDFLLEARPLIEQAARDYEQARRVMEPQSGQLVHAGNDLMRQAAGIWQQARRCFAPIFARWTQNGGRHVPGLKPGIAETNPPSSETPGSLPAQCGGAPGYATWDGAGHITLHCGAAAPATSEDCDPSITPDIRQDLMNAAAEMDRIATGLQNRAMVASNHMLQGMAEVLSADLQFLGQTAQHPVETSQEVATAVVDYLTTDYNLNNERLYDAAVKAVDEWQQDPAHALGKTVANAGVGAATGAAGALVGKACVAGAQKALKRAADIAKAKEAAAALEDIVTIAGLPEETAGGPVVPPPNGPATIPPRPLRSLSRRLWQQWEDDVFRYLQIGNQGNVARQVELSVFNETRNTTTTIRIDNLVRNPGNPYKLADAKFTAPLGRYLTTSDLERTLTGNQRTVADWMRNSDRLVFTPTRGRIEDLQNLGVALNRPIPVDPAFHIYVQTPDGVPMLRRYP